MRVRSDKILESAEGENCAVRIPGICNRDPRTVVLCHAPDKHRGKSQKTWDHWGAYACSACHTALDLRQTANREAYWLSGILETQKKLFEKGLLSIPEKQVRPKKIEKIMNGPTAFQRRFGLSE